MSASTPRAHSLVALEHRRAVALGGASERGADAGWTWYAPGRLRLTLEDDAVIVGECELRCDFGARAARATRALVVHRENTVGVGRARSIFGHRRALVCEADRAVHDLAL